MGGELGGATGGKGLLGAVLHPGGYITGKALGDKKSSALGLIVDPGGYALSKAFDRPEKKQIKHPSGLLPQQEGLPLPMISDKKQLKPRNGSLSPTGTGTTLLS